MYLYLPFKAKEPLLLPTHPTPLSIATIKAEQIPNDLYIIVSDPNGSTTRLPCLVNPLGSDRYSVQYLPQLPGCYHLTLLLNDTPISDFSVEIARPEATLHILSGMEEEEEKPPPKVGLPYLLAKAEVKGGSPADLHVSVLKVGGHVVPTPKEQIQISPNREGTYDITFTPQEPGDYMVRIAGAAPFSILGVKREPKAELISLTPDERKKAFVGSPVAVGKLALTGKPHDVKLYVAREGIPQTHLKCSLQKEGDDVMIVTTPLEAGHYSALLMQGDEVIASTHPLPVIMPDQKVCLSHFPYSPLVRHTRGAATALLHKGIPQDAPTKTERKTKTKTKTDHPNLEIRKKVRIG